MSDEETSTEEKTEKNVFPSSQDFFLKIPLYNWHKFNSIYEILILEFFDKTIDSYCVECDKAETVFTRVTTKFSAIAAGRQTWESDPSLEYVLNNAQRLLIYRWNHEPDQISVENYASSNREFRITFCCTRNNRHYQHFWFQVVNQRVAKVGQYPSLADLKLPEYQKYRSLIPDKYYELISAVIQMTHGYGVGSFVYLRRVFEHLIELARDRAIEQEKWNKKQIKEFFELNRIEDRILKLSNYLPDYLVRNRKVYSILSIGIHELSEQECKDVFDAVLNGTITILEAEKTRQEQEAREKATEVALQKSLEAVIKREDRENT